MKVSNVVVAVFAAVASQGQIVAAEAGPVPYAYYREGVGSGGSSQRLRLKARHAAPNGLTVSDHELSKRTDWVVVGFQIAQLCVTGVAAAGTVWWLRKPPEKQHELCEECAKKAKHSKPAAKTVGITYDPNKDPTPEEVERVQKFLQAAGQTGKSVVSGVAGVAGALARRWD